MYKAVKHCTDKMHTTQNTLFKTEDAPGTSYNQKVLKLFICCVYLSI